MAQSSSGIPGRPPSSQPNPTPSRTPSQAQPLFFLSAQNPLLASSGLTRISSCVEYDRLVGKIMRDNFWVLEGFTVGLNPGLLDFTKPYLKTKAPHIRAKKKLLQRVLDRMVEDEHLLLVCNDPKLYRPHPNRSTVDYLVMGDDPPWIPHFFNGSQAYPHIEEAMGSISLFFESGLKSQPPSRVPTVGMSRASTFAISGFKVKTEDLPSVEEYVDFVHAIVQSGSSLGSSGIIREDHFFPSMAVLPVEEVRKRANLIMRLMGRMVEDGVLTRVSAEDGTYVLHQNCRPSDYRADRGLTDASHWVWTFKKWAVLDPVAEKAVKNLDKFLNDLSPVERARVKIEREDSPPPSKLEPRFQTKEEDDDVYIVKQEQTASSIANSRTPRPARPKHTRTDRHVSSSPSSESSGSDQSSIVPILTRPRSPPLIELSSSPEPKPQADDSLMDSIEMSYENSPAEIQIREDRAYADYVDAFSGSQQMLFPLAGRAEFKKFHANYPNDSFEIVIEKTVGGYMFQIVCHDCDSRRLATKYQGSISKLKLHLDAVQHTSNVLSKLEEAGEVPIETEQTKKRMKVLKQVADERGDEHNRHKSLSSFLSQSKANDTTTKTNPRGSPSATEVENLQALYELPQKAFNNKLPRTKAATIDQNSNSSHEPFPQIMAVPSQHGPTSPSHTSAALEELRKETAERFESLRSSNKRRKLNHDLKLEHYSTLLGETNNRYEELEENVAALRTRHEEYQAEFRVLAHTLKSGIEPLVQAVKDSQQIPGDVREQLEGLMVRDEKHELRWEKQEEARINLSAAIRNLEQDQEALEGRIGSLETQESQMGGTSDLTMEARIKDLESSNTQVLEAQNELEQDHRVMNARFDLLEQHDQSLEEAASLIAGIAARVEGLEKGRNEDFGEKQKKLTSSIEALEQQISTSGNSSGSTTTGPTNEMIALLKERCAAQDDQIKWLIKASKKATQWREYFEKVSTAQKSHLKLLEDRQRDQVVARSEFEKRVEESLEASRVREESMAGFMEQLMKDGKEREEKMLARIKKLEQREEHSATQLALLKTYAPRSVAGENERAGSSRPPSMASSQLGAARSPRPPTQPGGNATKAFETPIRPPSMLSSQKATGSIIEDSIMTPAPNPTSRSQRQKADVSTYNLKVLSGIAVHAPKKFGKDASTPKPSSQTGGSVTKTFETPIRPPLSSSQMSSITPKPSTQASGSAKKIPHVDTPESSPPNYRKPRKF